MMTTHDLARPFASHHDGRPVRRARRAALGGAGAALLLAATGGTARAQVGEGDPGSYVAPRAFNGFDVKGALVPPEQIVRGGPPRDGIPSIDRPRFVAAAEARLTRDDRVLGVVHRGIARAYPVRILNWHEIVNDRFAEQAVVITYCPLCGSGVVFEGEVDGRVLSFGVSGLLFDNDMLLYDRQTESLWSQLKYQAVTGPMIGRRLGRLPAEHTAWEDWRRRFPATQVLSFETGFERDYGRDPYGGYERSPETFFPLSRSDPRLDAKAWVLGVERGGRHKAYPLAALGAGAGVLHDTVGGEPITIHFDGRHRTARAVDARGRDMPTVTAFWFAWAAFNPKTDLYAAPAAQR
jgi:hypothetical protein